MRRVLFHKNPDLEALMLTTEQATLERFAKSQERRIRVGGYGATVGALGITQEVFGIVATVINQRLIEVQNITKNSDLWVLKGLSYVIRNLDPNVMAYATLNGLLHSVATGATLRETCLTVGHAVQGEAWAAKLLSADKGLYTKATRRACERHTRVNQRISAARATANKAGWRMADWSPADVLRCGGFMVDCAVRALPDIFVLEMAVNGSTGRKEYYPQITPEGLALAEAAVEAAIRAKPAFQPSTAPPLPWTRMGKGGHWDERTRLSTKFIRARDRQRMAAANAAMINGSMAPHVAAVNQLQSVAWTINTKVLEVVQWCHDNDVTVKGLPARTELPLLPRLPDEEWNDQTKRRIHRIKLSQIRERNRGMRSDRVLFAQDMATAQELATVGVFYTPLNCDWRGRLYSVTHFNFQRDDRVRALFLFRDGMPIGSEGLYWLKVHVANCGDFNKISKRPFEERVKWVDEHLGPILHTAAAPTHRVSVGWWAQADKPFLFLAACLELTAALASGPAYITCLPVSWDGSCSGLQHLCAMTRAREGKLVNLTPQELPQDVYQTVAALVHTRIAADAENLTAPETIALAKLCLKNGITRGDVKRNVMTYAYSSKRFGMAQQQMEDTMRPLEIAVLEGTYVVHPYASEADGQRAPGTAAAQYLAGHIHAAIETVVHLPAQAMGFLQKCARLLAHEGKPLRWTTPAGLPWINAYHEPLTHRLRLWMNDTCIQVRVTVGDKRGIDKDRAANGVAPNLVHSLDAAHLLLTVNACVAEGINNIATVHDSFGCLAPQAKRFNEIIREQFVDMYTKHDVLAEVRESFLRDLTDHNRQPLPQVPDYGPLNLKDVLNAPYCFA